MSDLERELERLAGLLAQAEGTDNENEAEAFMAKAQALSTRYSISLATARARAADRNKATLPAMRVISIGPAGKQGLANYVDLLSEIAWANNLQTDVLDNSTSVYLYGFAEDIDLTEMLYGSLLIQMVAASERYLATGAYRDEEIWREVTKTNRWGQRYKNWDYAPVPKQTARTNFQRSFAGRIGERLKEAQEKTTAEVIAESAGTELVLADKAAAVVLYHKQNSDARGNWRGPEPSSRWEAAETAGRKAANAAQLQAPNSIGGQRKGIASPAKCGCVHRQAPTRRLSMRRCTTRGSRRARYWAALPVIRTTMQRYSWRLSTPYKRFTRWICMTPRRIRAK